MPPTDRMHRSRLLLKSAQALGFDQAGVMSECIERRYPRTERTARAIWRGTNTDSHGADRLTAANWLRNLRACNSYVCAHMCESCWRVFSYTRTCLAGVQLVLRAANMSHIADFGLTHLWIGELC